MIEYPKFDNKLSADGGNQTTNLCKICPNCLYIDELMNYIKCNADRISFFYYIKENLICINRPKCIKL